MLFFRAKGRVSCRHCPRALGASSLARLLQRGMDLILLNCSEVDKATCSSRQVFCRCVVHPTVGPLPQCVGLACF